jgi:hypothetical protein
MNVRLVAMALILCSYTAWGAAMPRPGGGPTVAEQYLLSAANAERVQRGLQPLRWDSALYVAANYHAQQMAERESISHQYAGEPELSARGQEAGARFSVIAENVATAPSAIMIQEAWMKSPKHRENLLEDFDHSVMQLSLAQQERAVGRVLQSVADVEIVPGSGAARDTCAMDSGYAGDRRPWFVMRYTASDLSRIPEMLQQKLASGRYREAAVGACSAEGIQNFSAYSIAVMLYK